MKGGNMYYSYGTQFHYKWPTLRAFLLVKFDNDALTTVWELLYGNSSTLIASDHSHKQDLWHLTREDIKMGTVRQMVVYYYTSNSTKIQRFSRA
jgi:hypothetical protein